MAMETHSFVALQPVDSHPDLVPETYAREMHHLHPLCGREVPLLHAAVAGEDCPAHPAQEQLGEPLMGLQRSGLKTELKWTGIF